jgi:hypothetical protein
MYPYSAYLQNKELSDNRVEAGRIARCSKAFRVVDGELYKRSITGVLHRCVTLVEGQTILKDIHEGIFGHHASYRAITTKAFRAGFYWLTPVKDAKEIIKTCQGYQMFAKIPHAPAT